MAGSRRRGFGYVRKLPSGRWQASYVGPDLVRRTAPHTFDAKADAEGWLGVERQRSCRGSGEPPVPVALGPQSLTFDATTRRQWLGSGPSSPGPVRATSTCCDRYLAPGARPEPIAAITPSVVRTWWA